MLDSQELTQEEEISLARRFLAFIRPGMPIELVMAWGGGVKGSSEVLKAANSGVGFWSKYKDAKVHEIITLNYKDKACGKSDHSEKCRHLMLDYNTAKEITQVRQFWKTEPIAIFNQVKRVLDKALKAATETKEIKASRIAREKLELELLKVLKKYGLHLDHCTLTYNDLGECQSVKCYY
jgi:hypothetical protein